MIDPRKFAKPSVVASSEDSFFRFGINVTTDLAQELRRFADCIESGEYYIQSVQTGSLANTDDYQMHAIMIEYAAKERGSQAADKPLYGGESQFPLKFEHA